jgi:protein O-GlcNAc transferase
MSGAQQQAFDAAWQQAAQALSRGDAAAALAPLRQCLQWQPQQPALWLQTAVCAFQSGQPALALQLLEESTTRWPRDVALLFHLAFLRDSNAEMQAAESLYRRVLHLQPAHADSLRNLAALLARTARPGEGLQLLQRLVALRPEDADLRAAAASLALQADDTALAQSLARQTLERAPAHEAALRALGAAARLNRDLDAAVPALQTAAAQSPQDAPLLADLGQAQIEAGDFDAGRAQLRRAALLDPQHRVIGWLGALALPALMTSDDRIDAACAEFSTQLERIHAELRLDTPAQIAAAYEAICRVLPFPLHYLPRDNRVPGRRFGQLVQRVMHAAGGALAQPPAVHAQTGRLRVGFVSAELREHTITRYFGRWLQELDAARFERWAWHCGAVTDATTARIAAQVDHFSHARATPLQLAAQIRAAALDVVILLDVGMDPRMHALAALPLAPRQYLAYGHPVSSGLDGLSGFLSGAALEPAGAAAHYHEPLVLLPELGALPTAPRHAAPPQRRARAQGTVAEVLCIQNITKLVPAFDATLARIARESGARIVFYTGPAGVQPLERRFLARISAAFRAQRLDPQQHLELRTRSNYADYLDTLAAADLVLDTPWFCGGATSLDTCHAGAPVVTWEGEFMRSRQTAAMLRLLDLPQTIASNEEQYIAMALHLLQDRQAAHELGEQLRQRAPRLFAPQGGISALTTLLERGTSLHA